MQVATRRLSSPRIGPHAGRTSCRTFRPTIVTRAQESSNGASPEQIPIGCSRYSVSLKKPLGIVLEQDSKSGNIFVVEVKSEGSAARDGRVRVGDQLIATSGVIYTTESDYGGATVKGGQQVVRLRVQGEAFKTVSAAIGSHPGHMPVTLEFQRCDPGVGVPPDFPGAMATGK